MLPKWKLILTNWINCYFDSNNKKDLPVNLESVLDIISHLRENLNLDESKSSLLDAHTVQEFMMEKFPDFKFENGAVEPGSDEDVYLVASLLLFFVCVNSKNADMKSAMCNKLSPGDQKIILNFSKQLMECSHITITDVQAAITEACGQEIAAVDATSLQVSVAETPPALRSFHSEVRRLQAALDAERFDRTFLQEELTRTNMKVEKLLRDKEQYKLEIVALKSQISLCCGQESESQRQDVEFNNIGKLTRQLEEMEERFLSAQEQLQDAQHEKETYKTKLTQLKSEHEKVLADMQQESARADSLAEELDVERRQTQSLRELVSELQQHNHLNRIDSSLLECDDPDASIHSLQHNSSACSEVCANVIEVQLVEERANIVALKQQIQMLQDQLCEMTRKAEEEKESLTEIILKNESSITNLRHRVNQEIEEKNNLKKIFDDDVAKLNNELNELEQRLKGSQENSRNIIEKKMREIQNLQEEKLSLLQSLSNETTKLENIIKDLQYEIDIEKSSKVRLREEYDSHIMKLNEKVLNRNNELVELQTKLLDKGEFIETLQLQLRREKELKEELTNKHNNDLSQLNSVREQLDQDLQQKSDEARDLHKHLQKHIAFVEELNKENDNLKANILQLQANCKILNDTKDKLLVEVKNREIKGEQIYKETENLKNLLCEEKQKLQYNSEETSALQNKLQNEIQSKMEVQNKLQNFLDKNLRLSEENKNLKADVGKKSFEINELNDSLTEEKKLNNVLTHDLAEVNSKLEKLTQETQQNNAIILDIKYELENAKVKYLEDLHAKDQLIESIKLNLNSEITTLGERLLSLEMEKDELLGVVREKDNELMKIKSEYHIISEAVKEYKTTIENLQTSLLEETKEHSQLKNKYNTEISNMKTRLDETEKSLEEVMDKSNNVIEGKDLLLQTLNVRADHIEKHSREVQEKLTQVETEKEKIIQQISIEKSHRSNIEKEYLNQCSTLNNLRTQLYEEIHNKDEEIKQLKKELQSLLDTILSKKEEIKLLEWNLSQTSQNLKDITQKRDQEIMVLHENLVEMEQSNQNIIEGFNKDIHTKMQDMAMLEAENSDLRNRIDKLNSDLKDNNFLKADLQNKTEKLLKQIEISQKCFEKERALWENTKVHMEVNFFTKDNTIKNLTSQIAALNNIIDESKQKEALLSEKDILIQELLEERTVRKIVDEEKQTLLREKNEIEQRLEKEMTMKIQLTQEKECITQQLVEERLGKQLAEQEKENMAKAIEQLQCDLTNAIGLKSAVEKQNSTLLAKLENFTQIIDNEKLIQKELSIENSKLLDDYKTLEETKSYIAKNNESLEFKVTELEAQIKNLKLQFEDLDQQVKSLIKEKDSLEQQLMDECADKDMLKNENERLLHEKNDLCLDKEYLLVQNEKANNDVASLKEQVQNLISEKYALNDKLQQSSEKHLGQLKDKQDEMEGIFSEYMCLKSEFKKLEEDMVEMESYLDRSLQDIFDMINKENIFSEELSKVFEVEKANETKLRHKFEHFNRLVNLLTAELVAKGNIEKRLQQENISVEDVVKQKELQIINHKVEIRNSRQLIEQLKVDYSKLSEKCNTTLDLKNRDIQNLQDENQTLHNELNDVKIQLDCKVHSLKDKLIDNENLTEKLKKTYDCQIDNLNIMVNKLTNYLKDKTGELDMIRKEKDKLQHIVDDNTDLINSLEGEIKSIKQDQEKLLSDFESERLVLKNMVTVTESVMDDQKISSTKAISEHIKNIEALQEENRTLKAMIETEKHNAEIIIKDKVYAIETALSELSHIKQEKVELENSATTQIQLLNEEVSKLNNDVSIKADQIAKFAVENDELNKLVIKYKSDILILEEKNNEWKIQKDSREVEFTNEILKLKKDLMEKSENYNQLENLLRETQSTVKTLNDRITDLNKQKDSLELEKNELITKLEEMATNLKTTKEVEIEEHTKLKQDNQQLLEVLEGKKSEIIKLESLLMYEKQQNKLLQDDHNNEKLYLNNKCSLLQEYQSKAEQELVNRQKEIDSFTAELKEWMEKYDKNLQDQDVLMDRLSQEKDTLISKLSKELVDEREKWIKESELKAEEIIQLTQKLEDITRSETDTVKLLKKENEVLKKTLALKESIAVASQENSNCKSAAQRVVVCDHHQQVDTSPTEHTQSSFESCKTISDLEKILQDRNRTIRSLQSDITDLKSLIAESENKLLDVSNDLEISKENCQQLSTQLKKIVHQKNEEIADLKKQLTKMSVTENRASQIIKVSAKYQAIILKRIAEIKTNTVLKELTNFNNTTNCDNDLRRSLNIGTITMEDLENFLDTTDKHLKRFADKQLILQKERDRLAEVNKINESEIINMRKFLTELSVSIKTFNSVKELYTQKLSRVVSLQRTVRREILGLEGHITDTMMCKLERGYAAVMQDLSECVMNLERWVERIIGRAVSAEKIKQAFSSEERTSVSMTTIQNASLEVQLEELENSFCKLLEEIARAQKGDGAKDAKSVTVMEVRAEYEDKLNRMKAKMKQLYQEQIGIFKEKQREEIVSLEQELQKARDKLEESSRAYEDHIRTLTTELWNVGEKFLMKKDEAEWLRRKQHSSSLMSLQHVHSSGLVPPQEAPPRPSDTHSLRSLPVTTNTNNKNEGRTLHMSDEEGEVFDNRCLRELSTTPARAPSRGPRDAPPPHRLSELQWRNSLCPPHLKSSYPAETQFVPAIHEEDIKCVGGPSMSLGGRAQRKEVGITAYKKPGPPTPSKQAGRLSATDSELRESLRVEAEPNASRKTGTPSRIRALFRSTKTDNDGTPRSRRLSNIFRKK